jgi:hypothetical protein
MPLLREGLIFMCCGKKSKVERIIEGWGNYIFRTPETESIAQRRASICAVCNENQKEWCFKCACYIPAKTRSIAEKCPKNLW